MGRKMISFVVACYRLPTLFPVCNSFMCMCQWKETFHELEPWSQITPGRSRGCMLRRELHISSSTLCWKCLWQQRKHVLQHKKRDKKTGVYSSWSVSLLYINPLWVIAIQICSHIWQVKLSNGSCEMLFGKNKKDFSLSNSKVYFPKPF